MEKEGKRLFYTLLIRQLLDEPDNDVKSCANRCRDQQNYSYHKRAESHILFQIQSKHFITSNNGFLYVKF